MRSITVAYGDGIGPEIMESVLEIISEAGAQVKIETIDIGQKIYEKGWNSGIPNSGWDSIMRTKVLLKAPITTPRGKGVQSLNVKLRKSLGLYANVRPCIAYLNDRNIDVVIIRENEEGLYSGIEYRQTCDSYHGIKFVSYSVSYRICKYAFEYARCNGRKKVTCLVKDNILKISDGAFHGAFKDVAKEYPEIENESIILDIGAAWIATRPEHFDVVVTTNLYGDIVSDIAADVAGSVGLISSINLGDQYAMFEAIHGSAPDIAGQNIANPSGLLNAAMQMLMYINQADVAKKIYNAWMKTLKDGIHTADIFCQGKSAIKASTQDFARAIVENIGVSTEYDSTFVGCILGNKLELKYQEVKPSDRCLLGVDLFIHWQQSSIGSLVEKVQKVAQNNSCEAQIISKGINLWPNSALGTDNITFCDNLCCRFIDASGSMDHDLVITLLSHVQAMELEFVRLEKLYKFGDSVGFSVVGA